MGTSADMAVRYKGRTYYQHTSYDGQTGNILSNVAGSLAACGIKALQERMAQEGEPMSRETEGDYDEIYLDRQAMGNAYLLACQARDHAPVGLDHAMGYEYGNPDFTHGGLVAMFAPQIDWSVGFCHGIEDTTVILDLDKETIILPDWNHEIPAGSYDAGTMPIRCEIPFADIDGLDPEILFYALATEQDFDEDPRDPAKISNLLSRVRSGQVQIPPPQVFDADRGQSISDSAVRPQVHTLTGLSGADGHGPYMSSVVDFLRSQAGDFPEFAPTNAIVSHPDPNHPNATVLFIDLRNATTNRPGELVQALMTPLAQSAGMLYRCQGEGHDMHISAGGMGSSVSAGLSTADWDKDIIPEGATPMGLPGALSAVLASDDKQALDQALVRAIANFDDRAWQALEDSGVVDDAEHLAHIAAFAVFMSRHFEAALPGSTQQRFSALSEGRRSVLLEAMQPIDRYLFARLIQQPDETRTKRTPAM